MDFFNFLNKNKQKNVSNEEEDNKFESSSSSIKALNTMEIELEIDTYTEFRKGDFVKIIYLKDSKLNCYKGYFGEIRSYISTGKTACIMLEAINSNKKILFPTSHFIKRY